MTIGKRERIQSKIKEDFRKTGLIHFLSISGAHFSLLFTVSFIFFNLILKRLPYTLLAQMTLWIKPSQLSMILSFPVIFGYFLLIEPNYPSTRAFIMATLFMFGVLTERKTLWLKTLLIACVVILLIDSEAIRDLSFQLSVFATLGVGLASDIYKSLKAKIKNKALSYLILIILISIFATVFTAPLVILNFHNLSLIGPIANITAGVLIGLIFFPIHMFSIFILLITGIYPFPELINTVGFIILNFTERLASLKFSVVSIPSITPGTVVLLYIALLIGLINFYCYKKKILYALSLVIIIFSIFINVVQSLKDRETLKITFLDVGHADASVIEFKNKVFVVDTGKSGLEVESYLKAKGISEISVLILTHSDIDHTGGFGRLLKNFEITEIWDNGFIYYPTDLKVRHLERGDVVRYDSCNFTILHPYSDFYTTSLAKSSNEASLVFTLQCFKNRYLFTSDAGKEALSSIPKSYLNADFIKVPHHGSRSSFFEEFYWAVSPKVCIISTKRRNFYNHPHSEVIDFLKNVCKIYETFHDGAIQIKENVDGSTYIRTVSETHLSIVKCCIGYIDLEVLNLKKLFILW